MKFLKKCVDKLFLVVFLLQAAGNSFAQGVSLSDDSGLIPAPMTGLMEKIVSIFTGGLIKGVLICSLAGCAVAYGFNKDNEKMKRNIVAIAVACAILFAASTIIENVTAAASGS